MAKPYIICVDDEKIVLDSLKHELGPAFKDMLRLEMAESGEEALELIEELIEEGEDIPVVISDWLMPGMKGDEFLVKIHKLLPMTRKIMLTGQASTDGVGRAVNDAQLYRYIAKPWQAEDLDLTVTEAFKSFYSEKKILSQQEQLYEANISLEKKVAERTKELEQSRDEMKSVMDKTLKGSINLLINVVAKSNPVIFDKAIRMRRIILRMLDKLMVANKWEFEIAALLSQLGCIDIDVDIVSRYFSGQDLNQSELNKIMAHPVKSYSNILKIPHLESVAHGIRAHLSNNFLEINDHEQLKRIKLIAKALKIANDFDNYCGSGLSEPMAIDEMYTKKSFYDEKLFTALRDTILTVNKAAPEPNADKIAIKVRELKIGMKLADDILLSDGRVLLKKGEEISQTSLMNLIMTTKKQAIKEPVLVYEDNDIMN